MNSPVIDPEAVAPSAVQVGTRERTRGLYPLETLQNLDPHEASRCQALLGHGATLGIWETPETLVDVMAEGRRRVDIRRRLLSYLSKELVAAEQLPALLDEGVLYLTRWALLLRMGPAGLGSTAKGKALDATTLARCLHQSCALIVACGIERRLRAANPCDFGFVNVLAHDDLKRLMASQTERVELRRMSALRSKGLWNDSPAQKAFGVAVTPVRGDSEARPGERKSIPFPPLSDDYMAEIGQRVLWVIKDLGPNVVHLLHALSSMLEDKKLSSKAAVSRRIARYFSEHDWKDRNGEVIANLKYTLRHNSKGYAVKREESSGECEWPPRTWSSVQILAATLQRAHIWLAMLAMAPRQGEVLALKRDCVVEAGDGQVYVCGRTFKPSRQLNGRKKEFPPPKILVYALAQQVTLIEAYERLARLVEAEDGSDDFAGAGDHLWGSLGTGGNADPTQRLRHASQSLIYLAVTLGLDPKPGGKNIHPHRMRKTTARLAGIAIDGAQKVLMLLLGHDDVATTLLYMQSDPAFAKEIDDVTREIRVLRGESLIADMHTALHSAGSLPFAGHGGGGAMAVSDAVRAHEQSLHRMGEEWGANTARELAILLTNNGESARLVAPHVICTKGPGEVGLCSQRRGAIVPGNCKVECHNHIEAASGRRDVERIIPILVEHAKENIDAGNWLPAEYNKHQLIQELSRYDDIGQRFRALPTVQVILGWDS